MNIPAHLRYTSSHEWLRRESDGTVTDRHHRPRAGRSSATSCSSSCPQVGRKVGAGEACAVVESVKAASDVYAPVAGEIVAVNDAVDVGRPRSSTRTPTRRGCSA